MYRDLLVSSYDHYTPTFWDWSLFAGMGGVFLVPFLLFVRFLPVISASETREEMHEEVSHRSEEHTSELQSLMRISYAVFCLKKKKRINKKLQRKKRNHNDEYTKAYQPKI